jgi:flagella basal body P-ring formation protein FlgA
MINHTASCIAALVLVTSGPAMAQSLLSPAPVGGADWARVTAVQWIAQDGAARMPVLAADDAQAPTATVTPATAQVEARAPAPAAAPVAAPAPTPAPAPAAAAPAPTAPAVPLAALDEPSVSQGPALKREVTVVGEIVRIGDLVENAGSVADVAVFRAPDLGQTGSVPAARVLEAVRPHHIISLNTRGLDEVLVTRASRTVAGKEIEARLVRALAGQIGTIDGKDLAGKDLAAAFDNAVRPFHVEPNAELGIARLAYDQRTRRFDATLDLPTSTGRRPGLRVTGTLVETVEAVVPLRQIAQGDVLKASDVMVERRPKTDAVALEDAIGFAAKRTLKPGEVIRTADLMKPELVGRNESVTLVFEAPGMLLTVLGKALDAGTMGDVINVMNVQSKRTLQGTVIGPARVAVSTMPPRLAANANTAADSSNRR